MIADVLALLPELCLLAGAVFGLLTGLWLPRHRQGIAHVVVAAALLAAVGTAAVEAATATPPTAFQDTYILDPLLHTVRMVAPAATLLVLALSRTLVAGHHRETEYAVLLALATLGAVMLAGTSDFLVLIAAYLLASVPLYALAGFGKDAAGTEASLKLVLFGALLGITMLVGVTAVYGLTGSTGYPEVGVALGQTSSAAAVAAVLAAMAGLLFKAGAVPAHFWVPDATEGAGVGVAAFLTTVPKVGAVAAIYRMATEAVPASARFAVIAAMLAAAAMTLGNLAAFWQDSVRRLLAYSTISQAGYLLIAVAAAGADIARPALLVYLAAYAAANLGAFAVVAARRGERLSDYAGLFHHAPPLAVSLVVCLLALVGTPPTAVFVGKLTVFMAGVDAGLTWLVVLAIGNTVASVFYYLRWIAPMFTTPSGHAEPVPEAAGAATASTTVLDRPAAAVAYTAALLSVLLGIGAGAVLTAV